MLKQTLGMLAIATVLTAVSSASLFGQASTMKEKSLYDRLGGKHAITAVVDAFVGHVRVDKRSKRRDHARPRPASP